MDSLIKYYLRRFYRIPQRVSKEICFLRARRLLNNTPVRQLLPMPVKVGIATSTICNADCVFCGYQFVDKSKKKIMPDEVFQRVVEEVVRLGVKRVDLTPTVGDPLVDKKILQRVKRLHENGVATIEFSTNGIAVNEIGAHELIRNGPDHIHISTCGFDPDEFKAVYRRDRYGDVISGIDNLLKENTKQGNKCEITISVISTCSKKIVLSRPDAIHLIKLGATIAFTQGIDNWNGTVSSKDLPYALKRQMRKNKCRKGPCSSLYGGPVVYPDGNASACHCRDINQSPEMCLGNIMRDGLDGMHQKAIAIIGRWRSGDIPAMCETCKVYSEPRLGILPILEQFQKQRGVSHVTGVAIASKSI